MVENKIKEMSIEGLRSEIKKYCSHQIKNESCHACVLSGIHHLDDINTFHKSADDIDDRYTLGLMVALIRGYLVWDESRLNQGDRREFDTGSNVPEQPTIPPMPEPVEPVEPVKTVESVESIEAKVSELSVNMPEDMTVIMISGKKPTSMTVFYDQEGGGD